MRVKACWPLITLLVLISTVCLDLAIEYPKQSNQHRPSPAENQNHHWESPRNDHRHNDANQENSWYEPFFEKPTDTLLVVFNGLLALFTWRLYVATAGLFDETKGLRTAADQQARDMATSLAISRDGAEAAKKAANVAEAALIVAERPYLLADEPKFKIIRSGAGETIPGELQDWTATMDYSLMNMGRSVGFFKQVTCQLIIAESLPEIPVFFNPRTLVGHFPVAPGKCYECATFRFNNQIDLSTYELIKSVSLRVFFFGYVKYADVFDNLHTEGFCFRFFNALKDKSMCTVVGGRAYNYNRTEKIPTEGFEKLPPQGGELTIEDRDRFTNLQREELKSRATHRGDH
jgi:hypothetical protein